MIITIRRLRTLQNTSSCIDPVTNRLRGMRSDVAVPNRDVSVASQLNSLRRWSLQIMRSPISSMVSVPLGHVTHSFDLDAFGCRIRATSDTSEGLRLLARCIFPSLPHAREAHRPNVVVRIERNSGDFEVFLGDQRLASAPSVEKLEASVVRAVDDGVVAHVSRWRIIHAGVVGCDGRALLLPGPTHSGKSTLVAELVRRGAVYYSDEYALIDPDGLVHPYPRPMLLRNGGPGSLVVPVPEPGTAPVRIGWILGLVWRPGCSWNPMPVDQSQAMMLLLQSTPHILATSPNLIRCFERAVAPARTYMGYRPEAAESAARILRLIGCADGMQ